MLDSVLMVYNKLKDRQERNIVQLCTSNEMKGRREGTGVIVVESSLQSGTSAETNGGTSKKGGGSSLSLNETSS